MITESFAAYIFKTAKILFLLPDFLINFLQQLPNAELNYFGSNLYSTFLVF
ncbi:hypothetical protein NSP_10930 [Nodularia spumigena CCY9414]|nr:hypothetical protein NSP_10930 [Nodularia spumigena CCY9414]